MPQTLVISYTIRSPGAFLFAKGWREKGDLAKMT